MPYPFANIRGRYGEVSEFQKVERRTTPMSVNFSFKIITKQPTHSNGSSPQRAGISIPWTRRYNEITKGEDLLKILPGADLGKSIQTDNKIERSALALLFCEMTNRVNRVGNPGPGNFDRGNREAGIFSYRQAHHREPIASRSPGLSSLVRRNRSGNKINAIEIEGFSHLLRAAQMAPMDRIEGAAEEADPHGYSISPSEAAQEIFRASRARIWQPKVCRWVTSKNSFGAEQANR